MLGKLRKPACRALAALTAALVLLLAPLSDYTGVPDGKIEAQAFAVALPAGIAAYEALKYALVAVAVAAGSYGLSNVDWDYVIWDFKYSVYNSSASNEEWASSVFYDEKYIFYDDGSLRNALMDFAMADMAYYYFDAVGQLTPDYDLSDLPGFDVDYDVIDNTAQIMERYFNDLLLNPEPITTNLDLLNEIDAMLEAFIQQLQQDLADIGAQEPEVPPVSAQNELNQAICEYLNYIVHAFEANSTFYQPQPERNHRIRISDGFLSSWLAFLVSIGLISEDADPSAPSGVPVVYEKYDTASLSGVENCVDITDFLFPGKSGKYYYGIPWRNVSSIPNSGWFIDLLDSSFTSWRGALFYGDTGCTAYGSHVPYHFVYSNGSWSASVPSPEYRIDYYDDNGTWRHEKMKLSGGTAKLSSASEGFFSVGVTFEKDGKVYGLKDFLGKDEGTGFRDPSKSAASVPTLDTGGADIYPDGFGQSVGSFMEAVDNAAASPSTDLGSPPLKELNDAAVNLFTPPSPVDPGNPDVPVDPDNPDVPVDPDNPDVPVDPDNPSNPDTPSDPSLSDPDKWKVPLEFKNKFPFSIPWDLAACVRILQSNAVEPVWEIPFVVKTDSIDINESVVIDLTKPEFGILLAVVRGFMLLSYVMLLAMATRGLIRG